MPRPRRRRPWCPPLKSIPLLKKQWPKSPDLTPKCDTSSPQIDYFLLKVMISFKIWSPKNKFGEKSPPTLPTEAVALTVDSGLVNHFIATPIPPLRLRLLRWAHIPCVSFLSRRSPNQPTHQMNPKLSQPPTFTCLCKYSLAHSLMPLDFPIAVITHI